MMARADRVAKDPQGYLAGRWWQENAMHPESHLPAPIFLPIPGRAFLSATLLPGPI